MAMESKVTLKRSDGELFEVNEAVAFESQTIKKLIEENGATTAIPLPRVSSEILSKVIKYYEYHVGAQKHVDEKSALTEDEIKTWDREFVTVDKNTLFSLVVVFFLKPLFDSEFDCSYVIIFQGI